MLGYLLAHLARDDPTSLELLLQHLSAEKKDAVVAKLVKQRLPEPTPMSN
jgi:hypothetical protein